MNHYSIYSPEEATYFYGLGTFMTPWEARITAVNLLKDGDAKGRLQVVNLQDMVIYEVEG